MTENDGNYDYWVFSFFNRLSHEERHQLSTILQLMIGLSRKHILLQQRDFFVKMVFSPEDFCEIKLLLH
jgi:hypothetical protein